MVKKKLKYLHDSDPWMLAEDMPDLDIFFSQIWLSLFVNEFKYPSGVRFKKVLSIHRGYHMWFYFGKGDSNEVGEHIAQRFIRQPQFMVGVNKQIISWADKLRSFSERIPEEHLSRLSNKKLWSWYRLHDEIHTAYYQWCWIPVAVDMFHNNLTNRLKQHLRTLVTEDEINEKLVTLTQPLDKSLIQIEREEFLKLACLIYREAAQRKLFRELYRTFEEQEVQVYGLQTHTPEYEQLLEGRVNKIKDQIKPSIFKKIEQHYRKYFYIKFMWLGKDGAHSFDYYLKELVKWIGRGVNPINELKRIEKDFSAQITKKKRLMRKLSITGKWRVIFNAWGDFMITKIYRRYAQIYTIYRMQPIIKEIARRFQLSLKEVRLMLQDEVRELLLKGKVNKKSLKKRTRLAAYYFEKGRETVFTGKKAVKLAKQTEKAVTQETTEIKGQVGCVGKATGVVKLIFRPKDMVKMKKGDILVSIATDPDIVPAMKKAAAIVTEQGGVTSHAAIVSREMNIPCVIGTKIATKVLKDGDKVEVDATKGVVKKI